MSCKSVCNGDSVSWGSLAEFCVENPLFAIKGFMAEVRIYLNVEYFSFLLF